MLNPTILEVDIPPYLITFKKSLMEKVRETELFLDIARDRKNDESEEH